MFSSTTALEPGWDYTGSYVYNYKKVLMMLSSSISTLDAVYYYYTFYYCIVGVSNYCDEFSEPFEAFWISSVTCNIRYCYLDYSRRSNSARCLLLSPKFVFDFKLRLKSRAFFVQSTCGEVAHELCYIESATQTSVRYYINNENPWINLDYNYNNLFYCFILYLPSFKSYYCYSDYCYSIFLEHIALYWCM